VVEASLNTFCASLGQNSGIFGPNVPSTCKAAFSLKYTKHRYTCDQQESVDSGGSFQGWRALINRSLWAQLREDGLAIPEISGTGRRILKMSYEGCSDEIHIGYSESNVSCKYLAQVV
jgi:hypothetical protein